MQQRISSLLRALTVICALFLLQESKAQGLAERIHHFKVEGINSTMLEKRCQESLLAFDPEMVVSIDREFNIVKVKTMQELPAAQLISAMQQVGITATLDMKKEDHTANDQQ